jgi:hypothetical protein
LLAALLKKFVRLSFLYSLLYLFPFWVPAIFRGFEAAGQAASGSTAVNPSQVLDLGLTIASNILLSFGSIGFLANPAGNLIASFTALAVVIAFSLIAAQAGEVVPLDGDTVGQPALPVFLVREEDESGGGGVEGLRTELAVVAIDHVFGVEQEALVGHPLLRPDAEHDDQDGGQPVAPSLGAQAIDNSLYVHDSMHRLSLTRTLRL